jgi:protein required for attachment to host cells
MWLCAGIDTREKSEDFLRAFQNDKDEDRHRGLDRRVRRPQGLILENRGDRLFPNLHTREVHEHEDPATHAQGSDAPGRVHQSTGSARSSIEQTDWHDESERLFLKTLADRLDTAITTGETSALTMVASPRALGMIRTDYSTAVRKALHGEIAKDLIKMPVYEIEKQLLA